MLRIFIILLSMLLSKTARAIDNVLTDDNIRSACRLWVNNNTAALELYGPISEWNTSLVTTMDVLFATDPNFPADAFNDDISEWDTSSVITMDGMFDEASAFNQPIGKWNVSSVTSMFGMFARALEFNQDLDEWDTSNVQNFQSMFVRALVFNGDVTTWDTSSATSMFSMFRYATSFDQELCWNVSNTTNTSGMFCNSKGRFVADCVSPEQIEATECVNETETPTMAPTMMPEPQTSRATRRGHGLNIYWRWEGLASALFAMLFLS